MYISKKYQYRVGVRRRFSPFFRKYWVVGHKIEMFGDKSYLTMRLPDGTLLSRPGVGSFSIKVYPEFESATEAQKRPKPNQELVDDGLPTGE
jgi:hypothetical protein